MSSCSPEHSSCIWSDCTASAVPSVAKNTYPTVNLRSVDITGHQRRFAGNDVPCPRYLAEKPDSISFAVENRATLSSLFLQRSLVDKPFHPPEYNSWTYVDSFGRSSTSKSLVPFYRAVVAAPRGHAERLMFADASSIVDEVVLKVPWKSKTRQGKVTGSASLSGVDESLRGSFKA